MKRILDVVGAVAGLIILFPFLVVISVLIRINLGSPIFFRQSRPGINGIPFIMVKFRSMRNPNDESGYALPDAARLTKLGRFLRATSLDEIPELWNVLKGEMSLVGPRPLAMEYLPLYSVEQLRRHEVRPGITGWAQINGRNAISWKQKFQYDVWYVENQSLILDIKILFITVRKVVRRSDVRPDGQTEVASFNGKN